MEVNYTREYFQEKDVKGRYDGFFASDSILDEEIEKLKKIKAKAQAEVNDSQDKINKAYSRKYTSNYTPTTKKIFIKYVTRSNENLYFSVPDGQAVEAESLDPEKYVLFDLETKAGEVEVLAGYCYPLAGIVTKIYKYNIRQDNTRCNLTLMTEKFQNFFDRDMISYSNSYRSTFCYWRNRPINVVKGDEFVNTFFGTSREIDYTLDQLMGMYADNKSFEIIIKTAPDELLNSLLKKELEAAMPIHKILGLSKEEYDTAIANGVVAEVADLSWAIEKRNKFNRTPQEWTDLIRKSKKYEKDLAFYDIDYNMYTYSLRNYHRAQTAELLVGLANWYDEEDLISSHYSFGKFVDYVVGQTIDQAYSSLKNYVGTLVDYLRMCETNKIKPSLYTSQLDLTHNIAKRNNKICVSAVDEILFKDRYAGFKDWFNSDKSYMVIAPDSTHAVKQEGNALDHCVASYIKRVIDGECEIYFLRKEKDESLLTVEIENNAIVQARGACNRYPNDEEAAALNEFAKAHKFKCSYHEKEEIPDEVDEDEE